MANGHRRNGNSGSATLLTVVIVVAILYFARSVLIPLSLALLFAFLLGPLVARLRHWGLGRVPAAVSVVLFSFLLVGFIGMIMASQLSDLSRKLPEYQHNVHQKIETVRKSGGGLISRVTGIAHNLSDALSPPSPRPQNQPSEEKPVPVEIRRSPFSPFEVAQKILGSLMGILVTTGIVIVFVIFMLIEREDLRDRLIRLAGSRRVNLTTKVLDDAAHRVSAYLRAQLLINLGFGILAGIGLYCLRVPNPFLWGMVAALLRYIPYLGIWIAATLPALLVLAVDPGWIKVPAVFGLYIGIDLCMYNFAEPLLYGSSTGISPLAILVAAVFWTWLWGPVGLLLATPLTVCVVVLGRHAPNLGFLSILLGDEQVLSPETRFYQRMLAMDLEAATDVAEEFLKEGKSLEDLFDHVIIPALSLAEEDRHWGRLDEVRQQFIFQNTRILVEDITERADELRAGKESKQRATEKTTELPPRTLRGSDQALVLCIPARDEADELAVLMFEQLLKRRGIAAKTLSADVLASESLDVIAREHPNVAFVAAVPPFGYMHARYLCRRLRQFSELKVACAILTERDVAELRQRQPPIAAHESSSSLGQALAQVISLAGVQRSQPAQPMASAG